MASGTVARLGGSIVACVLPAFVAVACITANRSNLEDRSVAVNPDAPDPGSLRVARGEQLVICGDGVRRLQPGLHRLPALTPDVEGAAIVIDGAHDLVLDLSGVEIHGAADGLARDQMQGFGIVLLDCKRVTIRGGKFSGFKVCLAAERCEDLVLEGLTFDGWFAQKLLSTPRAENEADWLRPHANDEGEWMTNYGAAIALNDCVGAKITRCRGRHGQNGILLTRSHESQLIDDDFSFLSGFGVALYRLYKLKT